MTGCVSEEVMWSIPPSDLLHDNNSKVWMIAQDVKDGKDYSPFKRSKKQTILFYKDGEFFMQRMDEWGTDSIQKGQFTLQGFQGIDQSNLTLIFDNGEKVEFVIEESSPKEFTLQYIDDTSRRLVLSTLSKPTSD